MSERPDRPERQAFPPVLLRQKLKERFTRRRSPAGGSLDRLRPPTRGRRLVRVALIFAAATLFCGFCDLRAFGFLEHHACNVRRAIYAGRHSARAEEARRQIVLVTLTDDSFQHLPRPPVPRDYHAKVIAELARAGVKAVAFDLIFDQDRPQDQALGTAARRFGRVAWACDFESDPEAGVRVVLPTGPLRRASRHWGHVHIPQDPERPAVDRVQAVVQVGKQTVPAFSLEAALLARGLADEPIRRVGKGWRAGKWVVPVDDEGCFHISFFGKPDETFPTVPYEEVQSGAVNAGESAEVYRQVLRGKIALIGDTTTVSNDYRITPMGTMAGVEIHAHAIATLLQCQFVQEAPPWLNTALLCLLPVLICPLVAVCPLRCGAAAAVALLLAYLVVNIWLFVDYGLWLHLVAPSAATMLTALGVLGERSLTEEREKRRTRGMLERYVSPQVARHIMQNPQGYVLGGMGVVATVLFSDIRGFTAMSERLRPRHVVERLNEYFQAMTEAVFAHGGTVDKYMGDAIMAVFGVPVPHKDHPRRAVAAALDMQAALLNLQARWRAEGLPLIDIGIGINTGDMIVGNIGSEHRLDFTVIGDSVNLASRVEGLNKELGTRILITELTYEFVRDEVEARGPFSAPVKGKAGEVVVYEVVGWRIP